MSQHESNFPQDPADDATHAQAMQQPPREPKNALGLTALIAGLVGILFGFVPLTGFIAVGLAIVGLALGFANRGRLKRKIATNVKTTWVAIVASLVALALGIWGISIVFSTVDELDQDLQDISDELDRDLEELERELEDDEETFDEYLACVDDVDIEDDDFDELIAACDEILN